MNILTALSILALSSVPAAGHAVPGFQYSDPGLAMITPLGSSIIAVPMGYGSALCLERGKTARYIPWPWDGSRCCSAPSSLGDSAAICINSGGSDYILVFSPDSVLNVYGPFVKGGRPAFDNLGNIWFSADGYLHRNGVSTGIELESHTISAHPSGNLVTFCDREDRICILDTADGRSSVLAHGYRFYNPFFLTFEGISVIVSPTLEGEIIKISLDDGTCTSLAEGSQPFWWEEREALLISVTSDDGHRITSGEIWLVSLDGVSRQITFSQDVHEIQPVALDGTVFAIEAVTGSLVTIQDI